MNVCSKLKIHYKSVSVLVFSQRLLNALFGLVTVGLIARYLDSSMQGWYYGFLSLASLYTLFDLGLERALVTQFSRLSNGALFTDPGRLGEIANEALAKHFTKAVNWYLVLAVLFVLIMLPLGQWFFGGISEFNTIGNWFFPWLVLVIATAGMLVLMPYLAFLEGVGHVYSVTVLRLVQGLLSAFLCWSFLLSDSGVWAAASMSIVYCVLSVSWLLRYWPGVVRFGLFKRSQKIHWRTISAFSDHWRVAISWICAYLTTQIYTLILMRLDGPIVAGKFGLTMALLNMVGILALSTASGRVAVLGRLAYSGVIDQIKLLWIRDLIFFVTFFGVAFLGVLLVVWLFGDWSLFSRFLPAQELFLLFVFLFSIHLSNLFTVYLRSYLREPLAKVQLMGTLIVLPLAYWAVLHYSSLGVVVTLCCAGLFLYIPWSVYIFNKEVRELWFVDHDADAKHTA